MVGTRLRSQELEVLGRVEAIVGVNAPFVKELRIRL